MSEASLVQADTEMEVPEATATSEQVSDVVLDFGVDVMPASATLLRLASPVFNRMLESGMKEAQQRVIKVDVASKQEFTIFYDLLGPMAWSTDKVQEDNVDSLLAISDYYQVKTIKETCETLLLGLSPTGDRLVQAHKHGLERQYKRCISELAKFSTKEDLEVLRQSGPDMLLEVALKKQDMLNPIVALQDEIFQCEACVRTAPFGKGGGLFGKSQSDADLAKVRAPLKRLLEPLLQAVREPQGGQIFGDWGA
ncbi:unnamed protein product [Symbiodinium sp. CCMP2592]|nr:unnamed protein product [Symbiodinium sp. CCMP2592]